MSNPAMNVFPISSLTLPGYKKGKEPSLPRQLESNEDKKFKSDKYSLKYTFGWIFIASLIFVAVTAWANALRSIVDNIVISSKSGMKGSKEYNKDDNSTNIETAILTELAIAIFFTLSIVAAIYFIKPNK